MSINRWISPTRRIGIALALALVAVLFGVVTAVRGSSVAAVSSSSLEASIFSYDGTDFVRTESTLRTEGGKSAVGTKLDHDSPAYKALSDKHSFTGEVTAFGQKYDANYAPLTSDDGKLTGALFVGIRK